MSIIPWIQGSAAGPGAGRRGSLCLWIPLVLAACGAPAARGDACGPGGGAQGYPRVLGAGLSAPRLLTVMVQDAVVVPGALEPYAARPGDQLEEEWIVREGALYARVIGERAARLADVHHVQRIACFAGRRLDRRQLDDPAAWRIGDTAGGDLSVIKVRRKSSPFGVNEPHRVTESPFRHALMLELNRPLRAGEVVPLTLPGPLGTLRFENDSRRNVSDAIHVNQHGWRSSDPSKRGFLALWVPGGEDYGIFDIGKALAEAGTTTFEIIDAAGKALFTGPLKIRKSPHQKDSEGCWDFYEGLHDGSAEILYNLDPTSKIQPPEGEFWQPRQTDDSGKSVRKVRLNPALTFVYEMDFSSWRGAPGACRVHVPGLGVSAPFEIRDDAWEEVFRASMAGLYHQRSGMALDGRFGYTRPRDFHPDDGARAVFTDIPLMIGQEGLTGDGPSIEEAGSPQHATGAPGPAVWGGYMDAGDWDRRIQHAFVSHTLLDLYELSPDYFSSLSLNLPASRNLLTDAAYAGADLPDILDEAVWSLDFFRRLQRADGGVPGGVEARDPVHAPSWLQPHGLFVYQPDAWATYLHAAAAAKGALVLGRISAPLGDLYRRSALAAWGWAESHRLDRAPLDQLAAFYAKVRFADDPATARRRGVEAAAEIAARLRDARCWAGAALYRLTGESPYLKAFEESSVLAESRTPAELQGDQILGHWELALAGRRDDPLRRLAIDSLILTARERYMHPNHERYAYANVRHNWTLLGWGTGVIPTPDSLVVPRAHLLDPSHHDYLDVMIDGLAFVLGGNQANLSLTTGLGDSTVAWPLHLDSLRSGAAAPRGITVYGFRPPTRDYGWLWDNPDWSDLYDRFYYDASAPRDDSRAIHPDKVTWPAWEFAFQHPENIASMEYTVHQCIATMAAYSGYLSARSGTKPPAPPAPAASSPR